MALILTSEGAFEVGVTDDSSSNVASTTSTPPTTVADEASLHSESPKRDVVHVALDLESPEVTLTTSDPVEPTDSVSQVDPSPPAPIRSRRNRVSAPVYNLVQLSGTAGHGKRRAKGDIVADRRRRRRTVSGPVLSRDSPAPSSPAQGATPETVRSGIDALGVTQSASKLDSPRTRRQRILEEDLPSRRPSTRRSSTIAPAAVTPVNKKSKVTKRSRKSMDAETPLSRELRRLQDTKEFAHIDEKPVIQSVWSNGKFVDPKAPAPPPKKKAEPEPAAEEPKEAEPEPVNRLRNRKPKKYLVKGLYAGQDAPTDIFKGLSVADRKNLAQLPELIPSGRVNKTMPMPIFNGLRTLIDGRDFKLPYQVCHPLPPGQPKPDEWKKMTKNRFIGESKDYWRKSPHFHDYSSKCVCKPEDGCGESCQNRIMLYECDEQNCNAGKKYCTNRAFANLTARRNRGGKYRVGVEVIKTSDRGYGVRSNRCFRPNQIIMEYAGEIITEEECERRMTEVYKDNECYYLMSFDQNMIIDATTGSIARFVNHSCNPNCRMIKWIVSGQPRMALFAGDKPIMTGDELTYDYNFDPFSAKNVQKCLCGEPNCRGVLGPKPREVKQPKTDLKNAVKGAVKAGKRKLKELVGDEGDNGNNAKKRKVQPAKGVKRAISNASSKVAKGAASAIKRGVSTVTATAKKAALGSKSPAKQRVSAGAILKKTTTKRVIQTYSRTPQNRVAGRASNVGLVAASKAKGAKVTKVTTKSTTKKSASIKKTAFRTPMGRAPLRVSGGTEIMVAADD
ncbi:histone-lysine n-methyltransferase ash1l [Fusarium sporotrichioides]|uniref:Histone-lysine n-methyltransferase ash1l n=1 Tax=Fusarium sporotrichioides TaxID=5514 RepID=A0A395RZ84_FUSSP|nr:histone-lysine n-methyltransferase ash1l [Fusarium sporotrichioides]